MATLLKITLTDKEMERYLNELGLYKVWNDLMYPPNLMQEGELNHTLKQMYSQLEDLHNEVYPYITSKPSKKKKSKFTFKNEGEFEKLFGNYFQRLLATEALCETAKHPSLSKESIAKKVTVKAKRLFDQAVSAVFNEMIYVIRDQKITDGEQPFDFI